MATFVWFHNHSEKPADSTKFYAFAGLGGLDGVPAGWVPFVEIDDVDGAIMRATKLGATALWQKASS